MHLALMLEVHRVTVVTGWRAKSCRSQVLLGTGLVKLRRWRLGHRLLMLKSSLYAFHLDSQLIHTMFLCRYLPL